MQKPNVDERIHTTITLISVSRMTDPMGKPRVITSSLVAPGLLYRYTPSVHEVCTTSVPSEMVVLYSKVT